MSEEAPCTGTHCEKLCITLIACKAFVSFPCICRGLNFLHWWKDFHTAFRATVRHAENLYKRTHSALDWSFKSLRNHYHKLIFSAKKQYYSHLVSSSYENSRPLWQTVNRLLHRKSSSPLPSSTSVTSLADSFASFFTDKISRLQISLTSISPAVSPDTPSGRHRNLKSIRSCSTVPTNSLIRTRYPLGLFFCTHPHN